jgi:hypothetical protein
LDSDRYGRLYRGTNIFLKNHLESANRRDDGGAIFAHSEQALGLVALSWLRVCGVSELTHELGREGIEGVVGEA